MGKQTGKKNKQVTGKSSEENVKQRKDTESTPKVYDKDTAVFISMAQDLKEDGNKHFQKRDYEGAMLKYEKALKLLPRNHIDVSYLRSNMAACHMEMGISEYPRAIQECNLALEVTPKYSKALLKRARCYEALNRLDLALRDVNTVSNMEPNNLMALEIADRVKKIIEKRGSLVNEKSIGLAPEFFENPPCASPLKKVKDKTRKKRKEKLDGKTAEDKGVVEEKISSVIDEGPKKTVKLVLGEDIRWAQLPLNCTLFQLREVIRDRFPTSKAVHIKYKDQEGDLVTITTNEELKLAETMPPESQTSLRIYVVEVSPEQDPFFERLKEQEKEKRHFDQESVVRTKNESSYIDDWIIQFAQLFKNHVGFDSDAYLNLHELGMKLYTEAMEDTVTSEEAQDLFDIAAEKFQEMAALAMFNWGNVHMSKARKSVYFTEDSSKESQFIQIQNTYDWAQKEFSKAEQRYEEALKIKPDFHEAILALGQQQFEQAKLSWYYALGSHIDLETWPSTEVVLQLYNNAEDNMEKGMQMWEESEAYRLNNLKKPNKIKTQLQKMGLDGFFQEMSVDEALEQSSNMRSQINLLWGTMLYERSVMEFKLEIPVWHECLEVAVEKFELAGGSPTDIGVMIKNHCSNNNAGEGLGFKIDEIVQAWNEMYEAKRWQSGAPSFRLEPLFCRRVPKLYHALEHV